MKSSSLINFPSVLRSRIFWYSVPPPQYSITRQGTPLCLKCPLKDTMFGCFFSSALFSTSISLSTISQCLALEFCMSISFIASSSSYKIHVHNSVEMQIILHVNTTHFNFKILSKIIQ